MRRHTPGQPKRRQVHADDRSLIVARAATVLVRLVLCAGLQLPAGMFAHASAVTADPAGQVIVRGAVSRPGPVTLGAAATVEQVLAQAGGTPAEAYPFASLLLRIGQVPPHPACVTPAARHAALLMADDPVLRDHGEWIAGLLDGRVRRLPLPVRPFGRLGSDRATAVLHSGDIVAVPQRSQRVYVVDAQGAAEALAHRPRLMAADYLDQLPRERRARRRDYVLHYPDGHVAALALEAWNAQPTAVPPGSMLAPAADCLPVPG